MLVGACGARGFASGVLFAGISGASTVADRQARDAAQGFDMRAAMLEDAKEKLRMIRDEPRFELLLPSEADEVLRALGEKS